jgi:hypothetical protein
MILQRLGLPRSTSSLVIDKIAFREASQNSRLHFTWSGWCQYHEYIAEGYLEFWIDLEDNDSNITLLVASPVLETGPSVAKDTEQYHTGIVEITTYHPSRQPKS